MQFLLNKCYIVLSESIDLNKYLLEDSGIEFRHFFKSLERLES